MLTLLLIFIILVVAGLILLAIPVLSVLGAVLVIAAILGAITLPIKIIIGAFSIEAKPKKKSSDDDE